MRAEKSHYTVYSTQSEKGSISKTTNILDIIKKNKIEEKREKKLKFYTLISFVGLILLFSLYIYL